MTENYPRELVAKYRAFYRAEKKYEPSSRSCIRPLTLANEILVKSTIRSDEELIDAIAARVMQLMAQIHRGVGTHGRSVISDQTDEMQAINEFAEYFVETIFRQCFNGDLGRYCGTQEGFLMNTCEFLYRLAQDEENKEEKNVQTA